MPRDAEEKAKAEYQSFLSRLAEFARERRDAYAEAMRRIDEKRARAIRDDIGTKKNP